MTKFEELISRADKNTFGDLTTLWNYHQATKNGWSGVVKNKNSHLNQLLKDESFMSNEFIKDGVTICVGKIGWSQHNESEVFVFRTNQTEKVGGEYFSYRDLVELQVRS